LLDGDVQPAQVNPKRISEFGPSRQAAFFGPTVASGASRTLLDLQLAPPCRE